MSTRKKRDTSRKRAEILDAAVQAFREHGFDNTSMDRIAEVAGASKRTVYNHFESKEVLFEAVMEDFHRKARELKEIPYDPDAELAPQLGAFVDVKLKMLADPEWGGLVRVGLGVLIREPAFAQRAMERAEADHNTLVEWLRGADADGRLRVEDARTSAALFWSTVAGAFFWPTIMGAPPKPAVARRLKEALIESFLTSHAPH
ncbi:MAG: TetR/AcrR family transcriptional regulator [Gemmatimonadota bacterium]